MCVSTRIPGPAAKTTLVTCPGLGRNPAAGSSALIRHSIAWPSSRTPAWESLSRRPSATAICSATRSSLIGLPGPAPAPVHRGEGALTPAPAPVRGGEGALTPDRWGQWPLHLRRRARRGRALRSCARRGGEGVGGGEGL